MNVDGDGSRTVRGESGSLDVRARTTGSCAHGDACGGVVETVSKKGEVVGVMSDTHDGRRAVPRGDDTEY
jgi:hypothetical protein